MHSPLVSQSNTQLLIFYHLQSLAVWTLGTLSFLLTGNHGKIKFLFNTNHIKLYLLSCQLLWQAYTELCGLVRNTHKSFWMA